ncbi:MAG: ComF family protein [Acidobacteriota bacterium]
MNSKIFFSAVRLIEEYFFVPVMSFIFPSECPVCMEPLGEYHSRGICLDCWISIKVIREPVCMKCGIPMKSPPDFMPAEDSESGEAAWCEELEKVHNKTANRICGRCQTKRYHFDRALSFGEYSGTLREIIRLYKFGKKRYLSVPLAELLLKALKMEMKRRESSHFDLIIAVPLHRKRERARGFNQSFLIARHIGKKSGVDVGKQVIRRIKDSIPQSELPADKREKNVIGVFETKTLWKMRRNSRKKISGKRILLIDDIFTTGATISECSRVLKRAGAKEVFVLTIAHTPWNSNDTGSGILAH